MTFFDAQLARYKILKIAPVGPLIGATVHGVDLADVSEEALRAELRRALADFQVLFFRNQILTP
jgi:taurine dioxygenase